MKFNILMFPMLLLPLFYQCNTIISSNESNDSMQVTRADTQESFTNKNAKMPDVSSAESIKKTAANKNPFGILVDKTDNAGVGLDKKIQIAKAMGMQYVRLHAYVNTWNGTIPNYTEFTNAGFKIILNINYGIPRDANGGKQPLPFPTDLTAYSKTLNDILDKYKPELVAIENEEDNTGYHSGDAQDYINELKTAIDICHAKGIKVTNGGLTVREMTILGYDQLMRNGKTQEAKTFAASAFPDFFQSKLSQYPNNPQVKRAIDFGRTCIAAYKTLDLDYVNFHWYEPVSVRGDKKAANIDNASITPQIFKSVVNLLTSTTGKPVITNEFGILNTSPTVITQLMQMVLDAKIDYAIFYSGDGTGGSKALQNGDGSLRATGEAARDFIKKNCQ